MTIVKISPVTFLKKGIEKLCEDLAISMLDEKARGNPEYEKVDAADIIKVIAYYQAALTLVIDTIDHAADQAER